mmetsp:Transcript_141393/g.368200  ORF Transcript_141393/g.368200 Transcript_141393/m.368200 type:complete len:657 (-) Transcript_141393:159-2129(-)
MVYVANELPNDVGEGSETEQSEEELCSRDRQSLPSPPEHCLGAGRWYTLVVIAARLLFGCAFLLGTWWNVHGRLQHARLVTLGGIGEILGDKPPVCAPEIVHQACFEFSGQPSAKEVSAVGLVEHFDTDVESIKAFLADIGLADPTSQSDISCASLCKQTLASIPDKLRPPSSDIGGFVNEGGLIWDVDLSPSLLDRIEVPDKRVPVDGVAHHATSVEGPTAEAEQARALKEIHIRSGIYNPTPMKTTELIMNVAESFRIYPISFDDWQDGQSWHLRSAGRRLSRDDDEPSNFRMETARAVVTARAMLARTIADFAVLSRLPKQYEYYMGPSETFRENRVTRKGCVCKKSWTEDGVNITDFCGNPDHDEGGEWCVVEDGPFGEDCEGAYWGYCAAAFSSSEARDGRVTTRGCVCKKTWTSNGGNITDYCGNPDGDPEGEWCMLEEGHHGEECQGTNWGACASAEIMACGPICRKLRKTLLTLHSWLRSSKIHFRWLKNSNGAWAKVYPVKKPGEPMYRFKWAVPALDTWRLQDGHVQDGQVEKFCWYSETFHGKKVIWLSKEWWEACHSWRDGTWHGNLSSCETEDPEEYSGTAATIIHELTHHWPLCFEDFLYGWKNIHKFVKDNRRSPLAEKIVRNNAEALEDFVEANNAALDK